MVYHKWGDRTVNIKATQVGAVDLVGEYGDLFWSLEPSLMYVAGTEIFVRIYVANTTDTDREYMLMAKVTRGDQVLSEFPVTVDEKSWFEVEANNVITLPGSLTVAYTDASLTLELYERATSEVTDSVTIALYSQGTQYLPAIPGLPTAGGFDLGSIMNLMLIMMVMVMMMKAITGKKKEE